MYCEYCTSTKQKTSLFFPGTSRMKKSVLVEHVKTQAHMCAIVGQNQLIHSDLEEDEKGLLNTFKAVLFLARQDMAIIKFDSLCSLIYDCNGEMIKSYRNTHSASEMLHCLATVHLDTLLQHVRNSPFFSIVIDESTDVAVNKQLIMYVRYIEPAGPVTSFATILQLEEGSALAIYVAICNQLKVWNVNLGKLVGFASDGAHHK